MKIPSRLPAMILKSLFTVQPLVHRHLLHWSQRAGLIPDQELRKQALMSIETKDFHCEGGGILGLLAGPAHPEAIRFIVAYQTISDYLDNLCDRSSSSDPDDFAALHEAMADALSPEGSIRDYYRLHREREDGGYLRALVETCREVLGRIPAYGQIAAEINELAGYYRELQVHKHVRYEERIGRLQKWHEQHQPHLPPLSWFEFSAATGSTLGIFCLVSLGFDENLTKSQAKGIRTAYFPWVQGLHILLDYLIDQEEDHLGGDLNFCSFYRDDEELASRLIHFCREALSGVASLPDARFHRFISQGLLSTYLADRKVRRQRQVSALAGRLLWAGGWESLVLYLHCFAYRRLKGGATPEDRVRRAK